MAIEDIREFKGIRFNLKATEVGQADTICLFRSDRFMMTWTSNNTNTAWREWIVTEDSRILHRELAPHESDNWQMVRPEIASIILNWLADDALLKDTDPK